MSLIGREAHSLSVFSDTCQKMLDNNLKTYAAFECVSQTDCMELVALMAYRACQIDAVRVFILHLR